MPWHPLLMVPREGFASCVVLSERFAAYDTHWDEQTRHVVPCTGDETCDRCHNGRRRYVYHYAAVWHTPYGQQKLLGIPESAWDCCAALEALKEQARGVILTLRRFKDRRNAPISITIAEKRAQTARLPHGWDIQADLMRRFGYDSVTLYSPDQTGPADPDQAEDKHPEVS
jgi:hypothetical protein